MYIFYRQRTQREGTRRSDRVTKTAKTAKTPKSTKTPRTAKTSKSRCRADSISDDDTGYSGSTESRRSRQRKASRQSLPKGPVISTVRTFQGKCYDPGKYTDLVAIIPVFGVCCQVILTPACSATETRIKNGPPRDKTCLQGFLKSETQTSLLSYRDWLEN